MRFSKMATAGVVTTAAAALLSGGMGTAAAAPNYYGALAVSFDSAGELYVSSATNFPSQDEADAAALANCDLKPCEVQVRYVNGCVAVAQRGQDYWYGTGATEADAVAKAMAATGPDPNPLMVGLGSSQPSTARVHGTDCSTGS
ncbi:DUF4189 domain-containing protein [Nocardia tengchongensis]|uniref:DUF4189 domain-containing protein n=1 Tax=Nocardia tengchongensis TaxID=2055889 RepID=UPI0033DC33E3